MARKSGLSGICRTVRPTPWAPWAPRSNRVLFPGFRTVGLIAALGALCGARGACAAPTPSSPAPAPAEAGRSISYVEAAKLLIAAGKLAEAQKVLDALHKATPKDREVIFLLAMLAEAKGDYAAAITDFRAILVDEPGNIRVRLELGRAFFAIGDDPNAEHQFRLARAARLPAAVRGNIDNYLAAIRGRRAWAFSLSLAVAPDSNINAGTNARQVDLYGLPFDLSSGARGHSGAGLSVDAAGEVAPRLSPRVRMRIGAALDSVTYSQTAFDDTNLYLYAGPQLNLTHWRLSATASDTDRWYGGSLYYSGGGARLEADYLPTARLRIATAVERQFLTYRYDAGQTGPVTTGSLDLTFGLTPSSLLHGALSVSRQDARDLAYANTVGTVAIGYLRELPKGFSISVEPSYGRAEYDEALSAFSRRRSDSIARISLSVLNRAISYRGFAPRLTYSYTDDTSSIPLYSYRRNRLELRVTRQF
ncbi:MAG: surface lipoprotein assembly modifier [Caulobacteraceae bacterium]|nr:surface lipoprotein assembly modifier [Caulobacteraceae bacterium]